MRSLLKILSVAFLSLAAFAGTTTLTGTLKDEQGNGINGMLTMRLPIPAQDPNTNTAIAPVNVSYVLVGGIIQPGPALYDVTTIQPSGLYYIARAYDTAGNLAFYGNFVVNGGSYNLGAATPTSITTSNISYLTPVFSNGSNTFTGTETFNGPTVFNGPMTINGLVNGGLVGATIIIANAGTIGTTQYTLTKLTGAPSTAVIATVSDTAGIVGVTIAGAGTTGSATIQLQGIGNCTFDGGTTANDYVIPSTSVGGDCHDAGIAPPNQPPQGVQVVGQVLSSNGGAGVYAVDIYPPSVAGSKLSLANDTGTGTLLNGLTKLAANAGASTAVKTATTDSSGLVGITVAGAGVSGTATIQTLGLAQCVFDGATTVNDYVIISGTTAGNCHDAGVAPPTVPPSGTQIVGEVLSTNGGAGTYSTLLYPPIARGPAVGTPTRVTCSGCPVSATNVQTTVITTSFTTPAVGGPFRLDIRYNLIGTVSANACAAEVIDFTNTRVFAYSGQNANGSGWIGLTGSEVSTQTYAANTTITLHLDAQCANAAVGNWLSASQFTFSPAPSTYLEVTPVY